MVDLEDVPLLGTVVATGGSALDLVLHGGTWIVSIIDGLLLAIVGSPASLVSLLSITERLTARLGIPSGLIETLLTMSLTVMFVIYTLRFINRIKN
jgi:hypothetical protein